MKGGGMDLSVIPTESFSPNGGTCSTAGSEQNPQIQAKTNWNIKNDPAPAGKPQIPRLRSG